MVCKLKKLPNECENIFDKGLITRVYREIKKITQQRSDPMKKSADD
jgi:hypothetical protein